MTPPLPAPPPGPADLAQLTAWGRALGAALCPPALVALHGDLGAGKTTLAQAVCAGFGVTEEVTSPTFTLIHEYRGVRGPVLHVDLFRVRDARDLDALGWDELLSGDALVLVEWPERAGPALPPPRVAVRLSPAPGDPARRLVAVA